MPKIGITVAGKIATNTTPGVVIICGNSDYSVEFNFDADWTAQTERTARFVYYKDGQSFYQETKFAGATVPVPILSNIDYVLIGAYAGNLITTTPAKVLCDRSILCGDQIKIVTEITEEEMADYANAAAASAIAAAASATAAAASAKSAEQTVYNALREAKESGEFDGPKGDAGTSVTVKNVSESTAAGGSNVVTFSDGKTLTVKNGKDGGKGDAGTSVTVKSVSESTAAGGSNVVTFSDGKTLTVKNGKDGGKGEDGTSVTVKNVSESTAAGGSNVVTFSDGKTLTVKNGKDGGKGDTGKTAYQYAVDGGYTGTEAEFAAKLAEENPKPVVVTVELEGDAVAEADGDDVQVVYDVPYFELMDEREKGATIVCSLVDYSTETEYLSPMVLDNGRDTLYTAVTTPKYKFFIDIRPDGAFATCYGRVEGGGSGGAIKHKRYTLEYAASDITLRDDHAFDAVDAKQAEVLNLLAELTALPTVSMFVSVSVPSMGEVMRLPALFDTQNVAMGTNGVISAITYMFNSTDAWERWVVVTGGISIYKAGMSIIPLDYAQAVSMLGVTIHIDVMHL